MEYWLPQRYRNAGIEAGEDLDAIENAILTANQIRAVNKDAPLLFSLNHLAVRCGVPYKFLRAVVERHEIQFYRTFRIRKRPLEGQVRYRLIAAPVPFLMRVQRWLAQEVLVNGHPHNASTAYARKSSPLKAAALHCKARWLIKVDVMNFFESVTEVSAYRVFRRLGYQPLLSFEMARLTTRVKSSLRRLPSEYWRTEAGRWSKIENYQFWRKGSLPQGAPTSPMLANLASVQLDELLTEVADRYGLVYSRYADDMCFSTAGEFSRRRCGELIKDVYSRLRRFGLAPQTMKTVVAPPGAKKVVLGLLVNGDKPCLTREFKARLRQHFHFLQREDIGPARHAARRGFSSVIGLRHHIEGLVEYAFSVDSVYGARCRRALSHVAWPL
jgi:RNA-directed DNA polymerase